MGKFNAVALAGSSAASAAKTRPLIIDVDTGRDDAWLLIGALKDCRLKAVVTSYGNVSLSLTTRNSLDIIAFEQSVHTYCGEKEIPLWSGEEHPIFPEQPTAKAEIERRSKVNGNGICNLTLPKSDQHPANNSNNWAVEVAGFMRRQGMADYVVSGPTTNLAHLIDAFGTDANGAFDIKHYVGRVVVMGGSFDPQLPVDFNFRADPAAAQKVVSVFKENLTLVPYDESRKLQLTEPEIEHLRPKDEVSAFTKSLMLAQARGWSADHTVLLHDPATLLALEKNAVLRTTRIRVVQDGDLAGKTVEDPEGVAVRRLVIPSGVENRARDRILRRYLGLQ